MKSKNNEYAIHLMKIKKHLLPILVFFLTVGAIQAQNASAVEALYGSKIDQQIAELREGLSEDKHPAFDQLAATSKSQLVSDLSNALSNEFTGAEQAEITNFSNTSAGQKLMQNVVFIVTSASILMQEWQMALEEASFEL